MSQPGRKRFGGVGIVSKVLELFGFIRRQGSERDLFFHSNELMNVSLDELSVADEVEFDIVANAKGLNAINVRKKSILLEEDEAVHENDNYSEVQVAITNLTTQLAEIIARNPSALNELEWRDLERLLAEVFAGLGLDAELTPAAGDGGKDVIVSYLKSNERRSYLVEVKHWRSGKRVGSRVVSEFLHVIARENRTGGILLATHGFARIAAEQLTEIEREKIGFGEAGKVIGLCRNYVKARQGIWYPPDQLDKVIFDDTL